MLWQLWFVGLLMDWIQLTQRRAQRRLRWAMAQHAGFFAVDLPLAGPVILAGLRVTAVSSISLATVGILVGVTNLGYLFTNGLQRRIIEEVFAGILAVALIALAVDLLLILVGRWLMPWTREPKKSQQAVKNATRQQVS